MVICCVVDYCKLVLENCRLCVVVGKCDDIEVWLFGCM